MDTPDLTVQPLLPPTDHEERDKEEVPLTPKDERRLTALFTIVVGLSLATLVGAVTLARHVLG